MPTSRIELVAPVINTVRECERLYGVKSVLDVGCGTGFYGAALRQYLDFVHNRVEGREITIIGVEPGPYENPNWEHYDDIMLEDVQTFIDGSDEYEHYKAYGEYPEGYDVVLACDVLEHMELAEAERIAKELYKRTAKYLIITTPSSFREQWQPEKPWEDKHQEHKCFIPPEMIDAWFPRVRVQMLGSVYMAVVTQEFLPV